MSSKRLRTVLIGLVGFCVIIFIAICVLGLSMLKTKSASVAKLKLDSRVADDQLANLARAKGEVAQYSYFKEVAKTVIPTDKDQAQAILDIFQLANESGISIQSIGFPASTLGLGSTSTTVGGASTSAVGVSTSSVRSQAKPVTGIPGLYSVELTISPESGAQVPPDKLPTYPKLLDFLSRIEHDRRTAQITQVNIQPLGTDNVSSPYINFSLTINIFIKP